MVSEIMDRKQKNEVKQNQLESRRIRDLDHRARDYQQKYLFITISGTFASE
jgi:hypothetical protein